MLSAIPLVFKSGSLNDFINISYKWRGKYKTHCSVGLHPVFCIILLYWLEKVFTESLHSNGIKTDVPPTPTPTCLNSVPVTMMYERQTQCIHRLKFNTSFRVDLQFSVYHRPHFYLLCFSVKFSDMYFKLNFYLSQFLIKISLQIIHFKSPTPICLPTVMFYKEFRDRAYKDQTLSVWVCV